MGYGGLGEVRERAVGDPERCRGPQGNLPQRAARDAGQDEGRCVQGDLGGSWQDQGLAGARRGLLAELAKEPAYDALQAKNPFGYADKVYKSEAIDPFGKKYLLGVYGTKKEAEQAFVEWNKEYEANRETMKEELDQWNEAENARLDKDTEAKERMQEILAMTKQHGG